MKRIKKSFVSTFFAVILGLMVFIFPTSPSQYAVGVKAGDWVKYTVSLEGRKDSENAVYIGNYSEGHGTPEYVSTGLFVEEIEWVENYVNSSMAGSWGVGVIYRTTIHLNNGTNVTFPQCYVSYGNDGVGSFTNLLRSIGVGWVIAANLTAGEPLYRYTIHGDVVFNETVTRTYLGISRETLHNGLNYQETGKYGDLHNPRMEQDMWFDRATGILLESVFKLFDEGSTWVRTFSIKILDSNLWSVKTPSTSPSENFPSWILVLIIGVGIIGTGLGLAFFWRRKRKSIQNPHSV